MGVIGQSSDLLQRMAGRDSILDRAIGKQGTAVLPLTSHRGWEVGPLPQRWSGFSANSYAPRLLAITNRPQSSLGQLLAFSGLAIAFAERRLGQQAGGATIPASGCRLG